MLQEGTSLAVSGTHTRSSPSTWSATTAVAGTEHYGTRQAFHDAFMGNAVSAEAFAA